MDNDPSEPNTPINSHPCSDHAINPNPMISIQKLSTRNMSKRIKEGDDSFESEHRRVNIPNGYFNTNAINQSEREQHTLRQFKPAADTIPKPSYPPFRISFDNEQRPSELSILKDLNKQCRASLTHGRYSSLNKKNFFLLYANSTDQFERLMNKNTWPSKICGQNYFLTVPTKVPTCLSIVAVGIPAQWDVLELESDIKKQYPTVLKVERLFVKGGIPISKVRIDFSSNQELSTILKAQRLLLDEENTSYPIQPYTPPTKILRCYNCQRYNDHIAANCPQKDVPVCFRCGQTHSYNPQCQNKICCAHCQGDHLTGSPNCQIKIEERRKLNAAIQTTKAAGLPPPKTIQSAWNLQTMQSVIPTSSPSRPSTLVSGDNDVANAVLSNKLDLLLSKVSDLSTEQALIRKNLEDSKLEYQACRNELSSIKTFLWQTISPFLCEMSEAILNKNTASNKEKFRISFEKTKDLLLEQHKMYSFAPLSTEVFRNASPHESSSQTL